MNKMTIKSALFIWIFSVGLVFGCSSPEDRTEMIRYEKNEIKEIIKIGDTYHNVLKSLGKPTSDNQMMKKIGTEVVGRRLMYIYDQHTPGVFNQKADRYLRLWFGPDDILLEIDYHEPQN